jgi:hypothetical protein
MAALVLSFSCGVGAVACDESPGTMADTSQQKGPRSPEDSESTEQAELVSTNKDPGPIGQAEQEWTKADCYTAWKSNLLLCNASPPNLRPECFLAVSALLGACLAAAD